VGNQSIDEEYQSVRPTVAFECVCLGLYRFTGLPVLRKRSGTGLPVFGFKEKVCLRGQDKRVSP
jgi:hypothetical protein